MDLELDDSLPASVTAVRQGRADLPPHTPAAAQACLHGWDHHLVLLEIKERRLIAQGRHERRHTRSSQDQRVVRIFDPRQEQAPGGWVAHWSTLSKDWFALSDCGW